MQRAHGVTKSCSMQMSPSSQRVFLRVEHNLIQNELVPIFSDDYTSIEDDDAFIGCGFHVQGAYV